MTVEARLIILVEATVDVRQNWGVVWCQ